MKHIQKIATIAYILAKNTDWCEGEVTSFIEEMASFEKQLSKYNERLMNERDKTIEGQRRRYEDIVRNYLGNSELPMEGVEFHHDVRLPAIWIQLKVVGKIVSNHSDNKSFVIDL